MYHDDQYVETTGTSAAPGLKPRTIFLLLERYAFFHSPSQVGDIDQRFMGRDRIIQKLKTLLTNAESSSGAYLVTGYRGMGKSSFVGKVLHEINSYRSSFKRASRYFRILLALLLIAQLDPSSAPFLSQWIPLSLLIVLLAILVSTSPVRQRIRRRGAGVRPSGWWSRIWEDRHGPRAIVAELLRIEVPVSARRPRAYTQDAFLLLLLHLASFYSIRLHGWLSHEELRAGQQVTIYLGWFSILYVWNLGVRHRGKIPEGSLPRRAWAVICDVARVVRTRVRDWVAHVDQVHIRINLGYDHLSELDVLRLLARNMATAYRAKMRVLSFPQVSWTFVRLGVLYLVIGIGYYLTPLHTAHSRFQQGLRDNIRAAVSTWVHPRAAIAIASTAHAVDNVVQTTYDQLKRATPLLWDGANRWVARQARQPFSDMLKVDDLAPQFRPVPADIDYLFWLYLWLAWHGTGWLAARGAFGVISHGQILRRLDQLNESIESHVTRDGTAVSGQTGWFTFSLGQFRRDYPRLNEREIEKYLIEILDDVARIPRISLRPEFIVIFDEVDKIEPREGPTAGINYESGTQTRDAIDGLRSRQETVLRLLSNLKYLLTTAKAKFIFIAGRELFDAALADVSDRNFFMGSIFNEVINVDSFLKDRSDSAGGERLEMSGMTEQFVFSALLPTDRSPHSTEYRRWVEIYGHGATPGEQEMVHEVLDNFVTYLTYRSNGAPKKLSTLFERHVVSPTRAELEDSSNIVIGTAPDRLYLRFDWKDQYTFSVAAYVAKPLFAALDRTVQEFGDKLLVSAAFLIDHLYKFHRTAFSWRSIELTPEILDINRAPHLRQLIGEIVAHLKRGHLKEIDNGLHNLKFRRRISEEIAVLSKLNEREAAAFNFTLDESLAIKRHYTQQLRQLQARYVPHFSTNETPEWIRSISFLHMIVGDLHFYDEEYDNAVVEYMEAVQLFGEDRLRRLPFESFVVFVRNSLKLGFAHERRRTLDSAYVVYGKLASRIIRFRELRPEDVNFVMVGHDAEDVVRWTDEEPYSEKRAYVAFREEVAGRLRLLYQPTLAKLHAKEKLFSAGITKRDVQTARREFGAIVRQSNPLVAADFGSRVGNVLFFKNRSWIDEASEQREVYCLEAGAKCEANHHVGLIHQFGRDTPCAACREYNEAIEVVCRSGLLGEKSVDGRDARVEMLLRRLGRMPKPGGGGTKSMAAMKALAGGLASAADAYLSCAAGEVHIGTDWVDALNQFLDGKGSHDRTTVWNKFCLVRSWAYGSAGGLNKLEEVLLYLVLAAGYFRRSGDYRSAGWQYTKILYVVRDYLRRQVSAKVANSFVSAELRKFVEEVERRARQNYDASSDHAYAARGNGHQPEDVRPERRSMNWDVAEIEVLCAELGLLNVGVAASSSAPSDEQRVGSLHNRILELRSQAIRATSSVDESSAGSAQWDKIAATWQEMIRVAGFFGPSYYVNHSLIGTAHFRAASALARVKGKEGQSNVHRRAAVRHYRMALDTHSGGDAYRDFIDRMVYLNDDFNDDLYHFCAAQERFWLNRTSGGMPVVYQRLDQLRNELASESAKSPS